MIWTYYLQARKALRRLKGVVRFRGAIEESHSAEKQATSALKQIHLWSRIQAEIRARWLGMVIESRVRQKKLENQLKLDAKLHELEVCTIYSSPTQTTVLYIVLFEF